jgi:tetratricopeptide (TPR) repeat protein
MKPMLFFLTMVLGTIGASMISPQSWKLDARPGPWIYCCMVIGLGLFLLHNLIDFSWFEPGAMAVFMMLIGSALGMAAVPPGRAHSRIWPTICAITVGLGLLAAVLFFVVPIGLAEQAAHDADDTISAAPTDRSRESAAAFAAAGRQLGNAASIVPYNAEYLLRKAKALWSSGQAAAAQSAIAQAKAINPLYIDAYYLDANLQLNTTAPDESRVRSDFETILRLNPNDASMHQQYGETLDRFGLRGEARDQYQLAIKCNAALPQGEPRRLSIEQLTDLQKRIRRDE